MCGAASSGRDAPARAVYLHFHGGGMVTGSPELMDIPNQMLAKQHGIAVVSADYRKAPEHPFPAGPDDGVAVARWVLENGEAEFGSPRLLIGGESAGGYMTAAVALRVRDELGAIDRVLGLNLIFGVFDWGGTPSQRGLRPHDGFDLLTPEGIEFFTECYLPGRSPDERRAPRHLAGLCRPPRPAAVSRERRILRPPRRRLTAARGARRGRRSRRRPLRRARHAARVLRVRLWHHSPVVRAPGALARSSPLTKVP